MMNLWMPWWLFISCHSSQPDLKADTAPLRRLTMTQIQNSLPIIFHDVTSLSTSVLIGEFEYEIPYAPRESLQLVFDNQQVFNAITPMQLQYLHHLSLSIGELVIQDSPILQNCFDTENISCALNYLQSALSIAWRRPIQDSEQAYLEELLSNSNRSLQQNSALGIQYILESPFFLYIFEEGIPAENTTERQLNSWEMATRLSLLFWNQIPNRDLQYVASQNGLRSSEQVLHIATQMLADPLSAQGLIQFHRLWLDFPKIGGQVPDFEYLATLLNMSDMSLDDLGYTLHNDLEPALQAEALLLILDEIYYKDALFGHFFTRNDAWVSKDTAKLYGIPFPSNQDSAKLLSIFPSTIDPPKMQHVSLPKNQRSGLLTRLFFGYTHMSGLYASPTQRGHFILERLLCSKIEPPPANVAPIQSFEVSQNQSNRDRYEQIAENSFCASCHDQMDGVGFAFEHYGVFGEYIQANSATSIPNTDIAGQYQNAVDLSVAIADSEDAKNCYVHHWFTYAFGRQVQLQDQGTLTYLQEGFQNSNGDIRELLINLVAAKSFRYIQRAE